MSWNDKQIWLNLWGNKKIDSVYFFKDIIVDRGSRYSVYASPIKNTHDVKDVQQSLKRQEYFSKATHNSYAFRIESDNGGIQEWKNDDGETGAGMCILRELQRAEALDVVVVVTRYFWWVHLQSDRFKHVINAVKILFEKIP